MNNFYLKVVYLTVKLPNILSQIYQKYYFEIRDKYYLKIVLFISRV